MSITYMTEGNLAVGLLSFDKLKKIALIDSPTRSEVNTLTELQGDLAELEQYCQDSAEQKRKQEQEILKYQIEKGVRRLVDIAEKINDLATEMEALMLNFKEIAVEVNQSYHLIQKPSNVRGTKSHESKVHSWRPLNIWDVHYSAIPTVVRRGAKFILTAKIVDLFKAEQKRDNKDGHELHKYIKYINT